MRLKRSFFLRPPDIVARELLGKSLFFNGKHVIIVETEAYGSDDPACHSFRGKTPRNEPMFKTGGRSYVYFVYGVHYCFNVVTEEAGCASAVLIRGGIPLNGLEEIRKRRNNGGPAERILIGPGNFCRGLGIGKEENDLDLCRTTHLYFYSRKGKPVSQEVGISRRIGISRGQERLWRFYIKDASLASSIN